MLEKSMAEESYTWCYITKFLCRYDSLNEAKKRYQERVDAVREKYEVVLASEQASATGLWSWRNSYRRRIGRIRGIHFYHHCDRSRR